LKNISIVLPAYLEAENLKIMLPKINEVVSAIGCEYEILVIDTMEPMDNTKEICQENNAVYVNRENGNNYGDGMRTGFAKAKYDYILVMDADGSHDPKDILLLYETIEKGHDVVIGSRYIEGGETFNSAVSRLMSKIVNIVYRTIFKIKVKDVSNSFKIYRADLLKQIKLHCNNFELVEEILIKLMILKKDLDIKEVPIRFSKRMYGETKRDLVKFVFTYIKTIRTLLKEKREV